MRGMGSLLLLVVLILAFAVGAMSRVTLDRSPQRADRAANANRAPSDTASTERSERTAPSLRLAPSQRAGSRVQATHTVKPGESLWEIASDQLGDGATNAVIARMVKRLAARNADRTDHRGRLETGQRLRLVPAPKPGRTVRTSGERSAGSSPNRQVDSRTAPRSEERGGARQKRDAEEADDRAIRAKPRIYTVKPGQSLWQIAERLLGHRATVARVARQVKRLSAINKGRFNDPDLLRTRQKLRLR